jgi:NhaA family Na+:H+ antiporter
MRMRQVVGVAAVAGIGFTVSLFVADLSFTGALLDDAKIGILGASVVAGVLGAIILRFAAGPSNDNTISAEHEGA